MQIQGHLQHTHFQFQFPFKMFVHCHTIIQDPVLNFKIRKCINQTPFLTTENEADDQLRIVGQISTITDLIILEATHLSLNKLKDLQQKFVDKHFLILTDLLLFSHIHKSHNTFVLSKDFNYSDFIEGLSSLADETAKRAILNEKIERIC